MASITQDQANLVFNHLLRIIHQSGWIETLVEKVTRDPYPQLRLGNGATIEARTTQNRGEYLLGNDYDLFIFDEAAFEPFPEYLVEEIITMRLADREGTLDLVSTPNGKNWLARRVREILESKRPGYVQTGDSRENIHISREFLDERVRYFSDSRLKQNIMGQFVDSGGEILSSAYVDAALRRHSQDLSDAVGRRYLTGWDLARKRTATVGVTVELIGDLARVVALERFRFLDWAVIIEKIKKHQLQYPGQLIVDATGLGDVVVEQLAEYHPLKVIFTSAVKAELLTNVELMHARGLISYPRVQLPDGPGRVWSFEDELRQARWDDNNEQDSLMALALSLYPLRRPPAIAIPPRLSIL